MNSFNNQHKTTETSLSVKIGKDNSELFVGVLVEGNLDYNSHRLYQLLAEVVAITKTQVCDKTGTNRQICFKSTVKGVPFMMMSYTNGTIGVNYENLTDTFSKAFDYVHEILMNKESEDTETRTQEEAQPHQQPQAQPQPQMLNIKKKENAEKAQKTQKTEKTEKLVKGFVLPSMTKGFTFKAK